MTVLSAAAQVAIAVLQNTAGQMASANMAVSVLEEEGVKDHPLVRQALRVLRAETMISTDSFERALDDADAAARRHD